MTHWVTVASASLAPFFLSLSTCSAPFHPQAFHPWYQAERFRVPQRLVPCSAVFSPDGALPTPDASASSAQSEFLEAMATFGTHDASSPSRPCGESSLTIALLD